MVAWNHMIDLLQDSGLVTIEMNRHKTCTFVPTPIDKAYYLEKTTVAVPRSAW